MKYRIRNAMMIAVFIFIAVSCFDRRNPVKKRTEQNTVSEKKTPGKIVFDKEIHNFGTLKEGEIVSFSFQFRNAGGSPLSIVKVEKSCGCVESHFSSNPVLPGELSSVELVLNTAGEWGNLVKGATIITSGGEQKELQIGAYIENKQFNNLLNTQK